ncbi:unnamed protein product, partial [Darwinula stevensoni]
MEPPLPEGLPILVVEERGEVEVLCKAPKGHPQPRVWWEDPQGRVVPTGVVGGVRVQGTQLVVEQARKEMAGNYTCVAENLVGSSRFAVRLYVEEPPRFLERAVDTVVVDEGGNIFLDCGYVGPGYPVRRVTWQLNHRPIHEDGWRVLVQQRNASLEIRNVEVRDNGSYACMVATIGFPPVVSAPVNLFVK